MRGASSRTIPFATALVVALGHGPARGQTRAPVRFELTIPGSVRNQPATGRAFVIISRDPNVPERLRRSLGHQPVSENVGAPFFAVDVQTLRPGQPVIIDHLSVGYPYPTLRDLPTGDYYVQGLVNLYTEFRRADGHVIWAHEDQWEGQHFNWSPGNLLSDIQQVRLDPARGYTVRLSLERVIPPIDPPEDTEWVKRVKIQSERLTKFWGRPVYLGATIILPKDYDRHPEVRYPVIYLQNHFTLVPAYNFSTEPLPATAAARAARQERGVESGYEFFEAWRAGDFPRVAVVTFQHPTPYFDDSYAVNSANNGPYGDALVRELIPYLEKQFRFIPRSYARILTGGSTGGYEALALQVHYPKEFGGAWVLYPDPIDFRRLFLIDIYHDENAFVAPGFAGLTPARYAFQSAEGQPLQSIQQLSQLATALGSRGRSTEYLEAWEAAFGPVGSDGYPRPLWDKKTGRIDRDVAYYWRDQGYDLRDHLEKNWATIGPDLVGKLHFICGEMDNYYFQLPVYLTQQFLESTTNPYYGGSFTYGRPMKGHGWQPASNAELVRLMARHVARNAPADEPPTARHYR